MRPPLGGRKRLFLRGIALTTLALAVFQSPRSLATCPPNCGLGFTVNTTFDAATGADDASPGNGVCETAPGNGVCTLRAAIEEANAYSSAHGGVSNGIGFDIPTSDPNYNGIFWTINLSTALPNLSTSMDITGPGADKLTVRRNSSTQFRIFNVTTTGTVSFSGLTIANGSPVGNGGGIQNLNAGTVNVTNSTLSGNNLSNTTLNYAGGGISNNNSTGTVNLTNSMLTSNFVTASSTNSLSDGGGIYNVGTVNIINSTLNGNRAKTPDGSARGGGIYNAGTVNLTNSTLVNNGTGLADGLNSNVNAIGGGIFNDTGTVNVTNSTLSGNFAFALGSMASARGGGIFNNIGTVDVINSTLSSNYCSGSLSPTMFGGGIFNGSGVVKVKSTIIALSTVVAQNGTVGSNPDASGTFTSQGFNLIGKNDGAAASFPAGNPNANNDIVGTSASPIDPKLDPSGLQNNGGPTQTIALLSGSPAIDKGTNIGFTGSLVTDQRGPGYSRTVDNPSVANAAGSDGTDVGAFEFGVTIRLISITRNGSDIVVTFQGIQGAAYRLERKLNITDSTWQSISGVNDLTPSSNGPALITDPGAVSLGEAFYRVRLL